MPNNPPVPSAYMPDPPNTLWGTTAHYNTHNVNGPASGGGGGGIAEAPTDGATYGRVNATWAQIFDTNGALWVTGSNLYFNAPSAPVAIIAYTAQNPRWQIQLIDGTSETGNSAGSNFQIMRWLDTGPPWQTCLTFNRATGVASFANGINLPPTTNAVPADGDLWYDGTHLNFHHGGTTTELV